MNDSIIESSTHTRARLRMMYHWLSSTGNVKLLPRKTTGMPTDSVKSSLGTEENYDELIHLGSYNYSGLNGHPDIILEAEKALKTYGTSTSGVRLLNGTLDIHCLFERKLASFLGTEDAVTFSSGLVANIAAITTLCNEQDIIFSDELNHQSIVDGIKLSQAKMIKFMHSNMDQLESLLKKEPIYKRKFIITDGVFSMDGDICYLDQIMLLAEKYNATVIVDDAHSIAAIGKCGRGTVSHFKLSKMSDVITGSLSKGLPGLGGYIAGSKELINLFRYGSNPYIFSASLPAPIVAGLLKAVKILEDSPSIMEKLHRNEHLLREGLKKIGLNTMRSNSPIIPVLIGDRSLTFQFAELLHKEGIYVNPIIFPAVPLAKSRLRINASAVLSEDQIHYSLEKFEGIARTLNVYKED